MTVTRCHHIHNSHGITRCHDIATDDTKFCREHTLDTRFPEYTDAEVALISRAYDSAVIDCIEMEKLGKPLGILLEWGKLWKFQF